MLPWVPFRWLALLAGCALAGAQQPAADAVLGILRDESGEPVVGAEVRLVGDPDPDVPALRELQLPLPPQVTHSDASGAFRVASGRPGFLVATTATGLGAMADRVWPGRAIRLRLRPMAAVVRDDGTPISIAAAIVDADGCRRHLPIAHGTAVRLPAGRFEAWIRDSDGWRWCRLDLLPAARFVVAPAQIKAAAALPADCRVSPMGFPHVDLVEGTGCRLLDGALTASLFVDGPHRAERCSARALLAVSATESPRRRLLVQPAAGAAAHLLRRTGRGEWRIEARAHADPQGGIALPLPVGRGEDWVLVTAPGCAALALPLGQLPAADAPLRLQPGRQLTITVRALDGAPIDGVSVTFASQPHGPATATAHVDELGRAMLGPIDGAGIVAIESARHRPTAVAVGATETAGLMLELEPGLAVRGVVAFADGTPAAGAAVVLRDARGTLRPIERSVASAADGAFEFTGLDATDALVLFASLLREGRTFSARALPRGGNEDIRLVLRDEDPELRPRDAGR